MPDPLDDAVDARIDAYRPAATPPFSLVEGRHRRGERVRAAVVVTALSVAAVLAAGLGVASFAGGQPDRLAGPSEVTPSRPAGTATPTAYPYTDCDALRPGDAISSADLVCDADNVTEVTRMDCASGAYVHLSRPAGNDLEGIVGHTSTWREAAPIDPVRGRTPWAFENCIEHG